MKRKKIKQTSDQDNVVAATPVKEWLIDSDVLDCAICFEPMTVPVFQCENGHTCCSTCCSSVRNKCPSCSLSIAIRNRAVEKIMESAMKPCRNQKLGCKELISYNKKKEHEKVCKYKPCTCPYPGCSFESSYEQLSAHSAVQHPASSIRFRFESYFEVYMKPEDRLLLLQEEAGTDMFVLHRREELLGSVIWLTCVTLDSSKKFWYKAWISGKSNRSAVHTQSMLARGKESDGDFLPPKGIVVVSSEFLHRSDALIFKLKIYKANKSPSKFIDS